jgi:TetR/AcrR family transcriptional regulator, transcriptional repressor for nem operon
VLLRLNCGSDAIRQLHPARTARSAIEADAPFGAAIFILTDRRVRPYSFLMRYSLEHKERNHENILSVAARSFREHGAESSGIGTVMKKVGLTKGGFYRHFDSKDDLFVEAVARAFEERGRNMVEVAKSAPEGQALRAMIEHYLSARHANSPGTGCVLSALGPELARKPLSVRRRIEVSLEAYRERLLPFVPGQTREERLATYRLLFPSMAGVLTMARVTSDRQRREQMLMEARNFFIKCFAEE